MYVSSSFWAQTYCEDNAAAEPIMLVAVETDKNDITATQWTIYRDLRCKSLTVEVVGEADTNGIGT